jgi:ABC-type multidrug transport system permease subunit
MLGLQAPLIKLFGTVYMLAMAGTAMAVLLGCSVEDPKLATEMMPLLFTPQVLFAGFFVAPRLIPAWLRWARYLCTLTYAIHILLVQEFHDCDPNNLQANAMCNRLLDTIEANPDDIWWNWVILLVLFWVFRLGALVVLRRKATKFF